MTWIIPLSDIDFSSEETSAAIKVLESRWLTQGAVTQEFEAKFAALLNSKYTVAVTNGTAALHLACLATGLGPGDEVIVPSLTFVATANAVRYVGATPVFADVDSERNLCISPETISKCLTKRTRAIIVMHYGGYSCDMPGIHALAKEYGLKIIEDAAHAIGSQSDGRYLGNWGDVGCFSFFSNKNLTTGEGGMVVTNDHSIAEKVKLLRSHGMTSMTWDRHQGHAWSYDVIELGYNYRIDEIRSAIGLVQLAKLERNNSKRRFLTGLYHNLLKETDGQIIIPFLQHPGISACHLMPIILPKKMDRMLFMEYMKIKGIQTSIHYPPIHQFKAYSKLCRPTGNLSVTEDIGRRVVTLPIYPTMTEKQVKTVTDEIIKALRKFKTSEPKTQYDSW